MSDPIRVGAVGYLNARPLVYRLDEDPRFDVRFDVPARCAELLHAGTTDLGLVPSIECARGMLEGHDYGIVDGLGIVSHGTVASVALYATRPLGDVRTVALDTSSRTSVALTRVLCARSFGITPTFVPMAPEPRAMLDACDAALLIGDVALELPAGRLAVGADGDRVVEVEKWDLGEAWRAHTGLPFVYACWTGPIAAMTPSVRSALRAARDAGCQHVSDIARAFYPADPDRQQMATRYLTEHIQYVLGPDERAGLEQFFSYAAECGVLARPVAPRYVS